MSKINKLFRVIFCANQVSLCIAVALAKKERKCVNTIVFFMPARCDWLAYQDCGVKLIPYSRLSFTKFLISTNFVRPDEVCVPHMRIGRLINTYSRYARNFSAIDDGMDSFREKPRIIVPEYFTTGAKYYTFAYSFPLATWLSRFSIKKTCEIRALSASSRPQASFSNITVMIIESPGIDDIHHHQSSNVSNMLIVKHSNKYKNTLNISGAAYVSGADIGLESTIDHFSGTLIVGESMAMVYALLCGKSDLKIHVMLTQNAFDNLKCLHSMLVRPSHNSFSLSVR